MVVLRDPTTNNFTSGSTLNFVYLGTYKLRQTKNVQINRNTDRKTTKTAH